MEKFIYLPPTINGYSDERQYISEHLLKRGNKFYIEGKEYEVSSIVFDPEFETKFGKYSPDFVVYTIIGEPILFELFFANRKRGTDYFCKWKDLGAVVVNVDLVGYKTGNFSLLYKNGKCYLDWYIKRDIYANTINKMNMDDFWIFLQSNPSSENILSHIKNMKQDDQRKCKTILNKMYKYKPLVKQLKEQKTIVKKEIQEIKNNQKQSKYIGIINACKNGVWTAEQCGNKIIIILTLCGKSVSCYSSPNIKSITNDMNGLIKLIENKGIRIMEVANGDRDLHSVN